jgi:uncharacterized protein YcbX
VAGGAVDGGGARDERCGRIPRLASIHIYPLKAGRAVELAESVVEPCGLAGDRRWLVVDSAGRFVSQREEPALARVTAEYPCGRNGPRRGGTALAGRCHHTVGCRVPAAEGSRAVRGRRGRDGFVAAWKSRLWAAAAGKEADGWLSDFLGRPVRLVYLDDPARREVDLDFGAPGDRVSFADGYLLLLTSAGSLEALGR